MATIISIVNHKGGVGKTTSCVNIAACLSLMGKKVLGVDLDPQAHFTMCSLTEEFDETEVVGNLMLKQTSFDKVVLKTSTYDLLPSSYLMTNLERNIGSSTSPVKALYHAFRKAGVRDKYDFVIMDCPPALGTLTQNALNCSDFALTSFVPEPLTWAGYLKLDKAITEISEDENPDLQFAGVFFIKYHPNVRNRQAQEVVELMREREGKKAFDTYIRTDSNLQKLLVERKSIFEFAPDSNGATDYKQLTKELLKKIKLKITV